MAKSYQRLKTDYASRGYKHRSHRNRKNRHQNHSKVRAVRSMKAEKAQDNESREFKKHKNKLKHEASSYRVGRSGECDAEDT